MNDYERPLQAALRVMLHCFDLLSICGELVRQIVQTLHNNQEGQA